MKNNEEKTEFTIYHAQMLYQTIADICGEKYDLKVTATVKKKE